MIMKKNFKFKIVSLALCALSCLALATGLFIKTGNSVKAGNGVEITEMHTLEGFEINETAQIRRYEPIGIRFMTNVSPDVKTAIINQLGGDASKVAFGTLILPTDMLGSAELTHNTPSVVVGTVSEWLNDTTYTVVLGGKGGANLGESYYNRPISARSFAVNTETGKVFYTVNTANRSIGYVAYKANRDGDNSQTVVTIAEGTKKELVFNEGVSVYKDETAGAGVIVNKYEKQSENVFVLKIGGIVEDGKVTAVGNGVSTIGGTVTYDGIIYSTTKTVSTTSYVPSSQFKILVPQNASEIERTAANKLQDIFLEATGVELSIVTETKAETTDDKYISVGDTALATANCSVTDLTKNTASRVKTVGNTVFVRGATKEATLYGVQQLLSDTVGYEFYLNNTYTVDETKEVVIKDKDYVPQIDEVWQIGADNEIAKEHSAVSYVDNVVPIGTTDAQDQGNERYKGVAHNSILFFNEGVDDGDLYTSSSKSYKKWYATNSSNYYLTGKSGLASLFSGAGKQELCYTAHGDSTVRNAMIEKLTTEMFRKMTTVEEFKSYNRVAFSHSDVQTWCTCSKCTAEGNPSDNMLHFILDVAANLRTKLANAGDARANTFKITTLFYNETNLYPKNIANYQSAVDNYMKHVEVWFAETRADYHVSLETATTWNTTAKSNFDKWTALANSKGADVLWWGYYASAKTSFIPYDSIDALRANYALAYNAGVDYMFNQMMQYTVNWSRLKQYLASELRWNVTPDDATWNGWIASYMQGAFGDGAEAMTEYYNAWKSWATTNASAFNNTTGYSGSGIYKQLSSVCTTSNMTAETLKGWIASCNKAISALDVNDRNYETYYNNIVLERMTPLYLIMHLYGFTYELEGTYDTKTSYSVNDSAYILPYAQDFLDAAALWNVYQDGEMTNLDNFKAALENQISGVNYYEETEKQIAVTGTSITLSSANIASGETYSATVINEAGEVSATSVTASNGSATLEFNSAPAVGKANVVLRSSSKVITFNNVLVVTGTISDYSQLKAITGKTNSGYYVLTNDITDASGTITLRAGTFSGVLDGNGYTVDSISVGASGLFRVLNGATIKNINFTNYAATGPAFGTTATNCTFENVTISFYNGGPNLATTSTTCTYKNVTIYVSSAEAVAVPNGVKVIVGVDTGKTFYISEGETEVWLRDERLVKGNYTVDVNGEVSNVSVFAKGNLKVSIKGLALGETIKVSCDNGTSAYVYNVMRVSKISYAESGEQLPTYNGDKTALGFYNADVVQTLTIANGDGSSWDNGIWNNRVKIFANGKQDYITVDFVATNDFVGTMFQIWPTKGAGSFSKTGVFNDTDDPTGATVSIVDEYGFTVNTVSKGKRYTLRVYDPSATSLAISVWGTNTVYFGNVTYGEGTPQEPITPPNVTVGDNRVYSIYKGDETALGFENGTMVFLLENATPDNIYGDGWGKRMIFGASTSQDYITFEFVAKEDVEADNIFHVWGANGAPSIGTISSSTGKGGDWAIILDKYGLGVTSIKAGEHYFASIACAGLKEVQVGALDVNEIYVANVTEHNGAIPTAIQPLVYGVDNSAVPVYQGDVTELGFTEGTLVFESTAGATTWDDNAIKFYTDSSKNCLVVDFVLSNALNSGQQFMIWTSKVSGAAAFINNGNVTQNSIDVEILDANGNAVTEFVANTKYTFKIYHAGSTMVTIALVGETQSGTTIYYSNDYEDTDDKMIALPENVVTYSTDGGHTGENLSKYNGDQTAYGFGEEDYVFDATMTDAWNDRAVIAVDSANYDYMDVEFVVTSGTWYFLAWVVNANGMLDGNYLVAENASNATYGSGFAPHTPNTGANGGKTKIQVLDVNGNVVTGGRSLGTRYILRVYLNEESLTKVHIGQANTTMLFANVTFGNGVAIEKPTEVVTNGSGEELAQYTGNNADIGFADTDYVFEQVTTDAWSHRAHIGKDSEADFLIFEFSMTNASNLTVWFTRNRNVIGGYSNIIAQVNAGIAANECAARIIYVFDENNNAATSITANTKYTVWVYLGGTDAFHGVAIGNSNSTIYYANVRYEYGADNNILRQSDANSLLPEYTGDVEELGFEAGTFVQTLVGESDTWVESIYANRARITASGTQDYITVDFVLENALSGSNLFYLWAASGNGAVSNVGVSTVFETSIVDENGFAVTSLDAGKRYTFRVYDLGTTYLAIGAYCNNTIYFGNVTYGTGELTEPYAMLSNNNGNLAIYEGDETQIGFADGDFVQQATTGSWGEGTGIRLYGKENSYVSIMFSLASDCNLSSENLLYGWAHATNGGYVDGQHFYVIGMYASTNCRIFAVNGNVITDNTLKANTVYMLEIYFNTGISYYNIGGVPSNAITIYFATKSIKTYATSIASSPITGSTDSTVTVAYTAEELGFGKNEVVKQLETETVSNVWGDAQPTSGKTRPAWLIKVASEAGKVVKVRFALSKDFTSTGMLFYVWAYSDNSGTCPANGSVTLSGSSAMQASITDEAGNAVTELKAGQVYELSLYCDTAIKYDIGNFVAEGMITYISSEVTYTDYSA